MNYIEEYYKTHNEDGRLMSRHGQVEYLATMKYIKDILSDIPDPQILEVGAGTGRYSVTLERQIGRFGTHHCHTRECDGFIGVR